MAELRGIAYPLRVKNGSLLLATDADLIRGHILSVLETEVFERVMQPGYGLSDYIFTSVQDINLIANAVRQALESAISDVEFRVAGAIADDGAGVLSVYWAIDGQAQPPLQFRLTR